MIPCHRSCGEDHAHEQQCAAEEYGGKEAVFKLPHPVAQYADEPQEAEARERQQVQGESDSLRVIDDIPLSC